MWCHKHITHSDKVNITSYKNETSISILITLSHTFVHVRTCFRITGHLGSGQFGIVEKGTWQGKEVALKSLKEGSDEEDKVKFLQEAAIMAQFRHPNIVTLHGVVSDREPVSKRGIAIMHIDMSAVYFLIVYFSTVHYIQYLLLCL